MRGVRARVRLRERGAGMTFDEEVARIEAFRDERDWAQFHNAKDLAISISLESAELLENFQWSGADLECGQKGDHIREELADVMIYCVMLASHLGEDPVELMERKLRQDEAKYPVQKSRGSSRKYTEL